MMEDSVRGREGHEDHLMEMFLTGSSMAAAQGTGTISLQLLSVSGTVERRKGLRS